MKMLLTGGAGFIGSHLVENFAKNGDNNIIIYDNLSRYNSFKRTNKDIGLLTQMHNKDELKYYNWNFLTNLSKEAKNIELINADIRDFNRLAKVSKDVDIIINCAGQTAVTSSIIDPKEDFGVNALGTFNILECARKNDSYVIHTSTNKVYGDNVNKIDTKINKDGDLERHEYDDINYKFGIPETFGIDLCTHSPYGSSKLAGDIYMQDYYYTYNIDSAIFRMSCIYGPRQFGFEDQGWVSWIVYAILSNLTINIFGDGMQVRDILYIDDLVDLFDKFIQKREHGKIHHGVYNIGGGPNNTISLLELLKTIKMKLKRNFEVNNYNWRTGDQKVYISDIRKAKTELDWDPKINVDMGINNMIDWWNKLIIEK